MNTPISQDISIYESGSGGEIVIAGNDIALAEVLLQQAYLCMFGGNTEADTTGNEIDGVARYDWWANSLIFANDPAKQFNSQTERALANNALNAAGRLNILAAVNADLQNFNSIANITTNVVILSTNTVMIQVQLQMPGNSQNKTLQFIWDNARLEVITQVVI